MNVWAIPLRAGDILTACDNELNIPKGYMGHSAIMADSDFIVEAIMNFPYIRVVPKSEFFEPHPICAIYRPVSEEMGNKAAELAYRYYQQSVENRRRGFVQPPFSFSAKVPLQDPWTSVYCSKLVWLSYYYGAGYEMKNDFGLFTPEDIDTGLQQDPHFQTVYRHPDFKFWINT